MCVADALPLCRGADVIRRCSSVRRTAVSSRCSSRYPRADPQPTASTIAVVRTAALAALLVALVTASPAAASFDWPPSRVAAVRAVIRAVEHHFPIMKNPAYAEGRQGIEATCRRRTSGRYYCVWRATNEYSIIDGVAGVQFARRHARVRLTVKLCRRAISNDSAARITVCANR